VEEGLVVSNEPGLYLRRRRIANDRVCRVLVCLDRTMSSAMGRPCAIQDEEYVSVFLYLSGRGANPFLLLTSFDLDFPIECDDEYWPGEVDPSSRKRQVFDDWSQPGNKPSKLSGFLALIKLMKLLSFALRTIVSYFPPLFIHTWHTDLHTVSIPSTNPRSSSVSLALNGNNTSSPSSTRP
jgi:hypothetical protein